MTNGADPDLLVDEWPAARVSLRVAVVTETYPPDVNGVALTMDKMVDGLRALNHGVQLVRLRQGQPDGSGGPLDDEVLMRGMPIPRYPHLKMGVPSTSALAALWARQRPDVVHIATEGPLGWSALRAATRLKLPIVSDFRTNFHVYCRHYGMGWLQKPVVAYLRKFHNRTQRTMVPTETLRTELARIGFENLCVVGRGVDTQRFDPARRSAALRATWGVGPDTVVLLCVGRLAAEKNLFTLCDAFDALRARVPDARLVLVGDGPARADLAARVSDVILAGVRGGDDLATHYASADLFAFASLSETYGNVTPEAMASGLPVVAFDYAAAGQWIRHGENGLLARVDDREAFIAQVCAAGTDARLRAALGVAARATALDMDWGRVIQTIESVLIDAVRAREPSRPLGVAAAAGH